jgi:DeoR/GlpR family transcriptional regulator of sugar metabolism
MLAAERKDLLVTRLRRDGKLVARDLAAELGLSEDSVRRDLRDLALLVLAGVHPEAGLTAGEAEEAALRRILIGAAADTYVLASIEKLGTVCPYTVTALPAVAGSVTDAPASHPAVRDFRARGVHVIEA